MHICCFRKGCTLSKLPYYIYSAKWFVSGHLSGKDCHGMHLAYAESRKKN